MSTPLVDVSVLRWMPTDRPADVRAVRAALAALMARVPMPGASAEDADVSVDGRTVSLQVASVASLSSWCDVLGLKGSAMSSRDGGGAAWHVTLPPQAELPGVRVDLSTVSGEFEELPRTLLVRTMCPWMPRLWERADREAAALARMGWVA